jgi:hypothetical protein
MAKGTGQVGRGSDGFAPATFPLLASATGVPPGPLTHVPLTQIRLPLQSVSRPHGAIAVGLPEPPQALAAAAKLAAAATKATEARRDPVPRGTRACMGTPIL